jgi:uncharacterized protein (DUF486 family)
MSDAGDACSRVLVERFKLNACNVFTAESECSSAVRSRGARLVEVTPHSLSTMTNYLAPIVLLLGSNIFMTFAWYGHLKYTDRSLWIVILVSWGIAFFEYCLQVPGNRIGIRVYSPAQLKTIQEIITLIVFVAFSVFYLGAAIKWNHLVGFALIVIAAFFIFLD